MQIDLVPDAAVEAAARWLANDRDPIGKAVIPEVRTRFGISTAEAIEACRIAAKLTKGGANGATS